ncbi:hypothetical protein SAMN05216486_11919 [bacterium JGI 053]|nr:hypothetical protein SAMN05216486_11919 [bacterium JGI 053]
MVAAGFAWLFTNQFGHWVVVIGTNIAAGVALYLCYRQSGEDKRWNEQEFWELEFDWEHSYFCLRCETRFVD